MSDLRVDPAILEQQRAWSSKESLEFYRRHRQTPDDLYPSERFFLPAVVPQVASMVDVGCAAGGFSAVVKSFNPRIRYVGVDVERNFVAAAKADHPDSEFVLGDGIHFDTPPGTFELAHSSGVLHVNLRYREMIDAMWAQTSRFLLCDLRLTRFTPEVGRMISPFGEREAVSLPYIVLAVQDAIDLFTSLKPAPVRLQVKGYRHSANATATLANPDVIMAFFLAEKGTSGAAPRVDVDLDAR
jgi:SAM-dependent methyltransferase